MVTYPLIYFKIISETQSNFFTKIKPLDVSNLYASYVLSLIKPTQRPHKLLRRERY